MRSFWARRCACLRIAQGADGAPVGNGAGGRSARGAERPIGHPQRARAVGRGRTAWDDPANQIFQIVSQHVDGGKFLYYVGKF